METDLELAYRTLNAISQGQSVSPDEVELALACVSRAIHQVRAIRRRHDDIGRFLEEPYVDSVLAGPSRHPVALMLHGYGEELAV